MKHPVHFDVVIDHLRKWQTDLVQSLKDSNGDSSLINVKRQVDHAVACLQLCQNYQIQPDSEVIPIPWSKDSFGGFMVADVGENEVLERGTPLAVDGRTVFLSFGDLVIRHHHPQIGPRKPR